MILRALGYAEGSDNTLLDKLVADGAVLAEAAEPIQQLFAASKEAGNNNNVKEETLSLSA